MNASESMIVIICRNITNVSEAMSVSIYRMYQRPWLIVSTGTVFIDT
jgi:hypothetical protein